MKNGDIIFIFRARYSSPEKAYESYISPYVCIYKNKKGVLFQPFESFRVKPPVFGLWHDHEHYLNSATSIAEYFKISEDRALKLMGELKRWHDATRGVKVIESAELLKYVNSELKKYELPGFKTLDTLYANTENWPRWNY